MTRVPSEIDAMSGSFLGERAILERIRHNLIARASHTGEAYAVEEEVTWMLNHLVLQSLAAKEERAALVKWLAENGHKDAAEAVRLEAPDEW